MKYKVHHTTRYEYDAAVPFCQNIVYLTPRDTPYQHCLRHRLHVHPHPTTSHRRSDYFGNSATSFSVDKGHRTLKILANSAVELRARPVPAADTTEPWEAVVNRLQGDTSLVGLATYQFTFPSRQVTFFAPLTNYARRSFPAGRPILAAVTNLCQRIHADFTYDTDATDVGTPIAQAFEMRRGVCQDLAHVMLAGLRPLGLAARYVSGYVRTHPAAGQPRLTGADASHAWVSVFCGRDGWIDVDPTNNVLPQTEHITVAWGQDYRDVCPVSGMFIGEGGHRISVAVEVSPLE
jgi:transglutaminase-like putative cysteine protease